jgi:PAS domain S-box-containing protein
MSMSTKWAHFSTGSGIAMSLARQINEYVARVGDLRARQNMLREDPAFFGALYEEVSQGIEELRIAEEELRHRDSEIYQAYAAVVQERRRYKDLFDHGLDAHLITDRQGVVVEANVRAQELLGGSAEFLRGKPIITFLSGGAQRRSFRTWFAEVSNGTAETGSVALLSRHREAFAAELRVTRVTGETPGASQLLWTLVDVSEKLAARRDAELAAVVRVSGDAILIVSSEGAVAAQNPASQRLYGDLVGLPVRDMVLPARQHEHQRTISALCTASPVASVDSVHRRDGGAPIEVSVTYSLIDEPAGSPLRVAMVIRDISARKQLESELTQRAVEREQSDRKKTEFISVLAHELRNPLNVIASAMQALASNGDPASGERLSAICLRNTRHMTRLIDELLDLSRISRDDLPIAPRLAKINEIVGRAIELVRPTFEGRKHNLEIELPEQALMIRADPTRLIQAISNLLDNAAKYTPPGGRVRVSVIADDRGVHIRVQDDGAGIAPELIGHVFEPFVQGSTNRSGGGGLGIGLALVRRIAELHGGTVNVESAGVGLGARFTISLPPAARADEASLERVTHPSADALDD